MVTRTASIHPLRFGKREPRPLDALPVARTGRIGDDLRLFAMTFAAGFLFVSLYIA